jgi:hypothetical protein
MTLRLSGCGWNWDYGAPVENGISRSPLPSAVASLPPSSHYGAIVNYRADHNFSWGFQNRPPIRAHIQDSDDLNAVWKDPITNEGLPNHDAPQIRKDGRFDPVSAPRVFPDHDARCLHLSGDRQFNPPSKLTPGIPTDTPPVFPGYFCESNPQSSSGSVKNSGGQSRSLAPFAALNFCSKAGVAPYVRLVVGAGIATIERCPLASRIMYSPYGASAMNSSGRTSRLRLSCFAMVTNCAIMGFSHVRRAQSRARVAPFTGIHRALLRPSWAGHAVLFVVE